MANFTGPSSADTWTGSDANETAQGGAGADILNGAGGADMLDGWTGDDILTGGAGADTFFFAEQAGMGDDVITDFNLAEDRFYVLQKAFTAAQVVGGDTILTHDGGTVRVVGINNTLTLDQWNALRKAPEGGVPITFIGTAGADRVIGGDGDDTLSGLGGDDYLNGGFGKDTLNGGDGADRLYGGSGADTLTGGAGADIFTFSQPLTVADGFDGADLITDFDPMVDRFELNMRRFTAAAIDGADTVLAWAGGTIRVAGVNTLSLSDWNRLAGLDAPLVITGKDPVPGEPLQIQRLFGGNSDDVLTGGAGVDHLHGWQGDDVMTGGAGFDLFIFGAPPYWARNTIGNDVITDFNPLQDKLAMDSAFTALEVRGADTLLTWSDGTILMKGINHLSLAEWNVYATGVGSLLLDGDAGPEQMTGGDGADTLSGGGGDDRISGLAGNDMLSGGTGKDILWGEGGSDVLNGGSGGDVLMGGEGDDRLDGGAGNDVLDGGLGDDTFTGGVGGDIFRFGANNGGADVITDFDFDWDRLDAGPQGFTQAVADGADTVLTYAGGTVRLLGVTRSLAELNEMSQYGIYYPSDDVIARTGGDQKDWMIGGMGDDVLSGGGGDDELKGGGGDDILTGGEGRDLFIFAVSPGHPSGTGSDTITDFDVVNDRIQLAAGADFTEMEVIGEDTILHHAEGQVRIVGVNNLLLESWREIGQRGFPAPEEG